MLKNMQFFQDLPASSSRAFLFRQMEGGELWYENVFFNPLPKLRQNEPVDSLLQEKVSMTRGWKGE
jgi:hypothetical protein